ncbi:MAG TPA: DUF58 domain-containing protein [Acidimicrobiales bacterium]|nr:DUF58 domain-containing protein [Acidimicrobiales bacterium]
MTGHADRANPIGTSARRRRFIGPVRPLVPLVSCASVLVAWGLVAHNSGAGWVQAVGDVLAGILGVGLLAPAVVVARARLRIIEVPSDGTAGLPVELVADANTRLRVKPVDPPGPESFVGPHTAPTPAQPITLLPPSRGVHDRVVVEVASAAPFGLLWWRKNVVVALPRTLHVGPRLGRPLALPGAGEDTSGAGVVDSAVQIGEPRGVRPYRPGDHRRFVHWPATAHSGELMVREMEGPSAEPVTLEIHLPADVDAAERMAERAMATVVALVDRGASVLLTTTEATGPKTGSVGDRRSAGRRLARAVGDRPIGDGGPSVTRR